MFEERYTHSRRFGQRDYTNQFPTLFPKRIPLLLHRIGILKIRFKVNMHIFPSVHTLFILRPFPKINQSTNLLLSDVLMPELDGPDLAEQLRAVRPDVRVIFMSAEWVPDGVCPCPEAVTPRCAHEHHS